MWERNTAYVETPAVSAPGPRSRTDVEGARHKSKREVDASGNPDERPHWPVRDEDAVHLDRDVGISLLELGRIAQCVVTRRPLRKPALANMNAATQIKAIVRIPRFVSSDQPFAKCDVRTFVSTSNRVSTNVLLLHGATGFKVDHLQ